MLNQRYEDMQAAAKRLYRELAEVAKLARDVQSLGIAIEQLRDPRNATDCTYVGAAEQCATKLAEYKHLVDRFPVLGEILKLRGER